MKLHQVQHSFLLVCNTLANIFITAPPVLILSYKCCICLIFPLLKPGTALYLAKLFPPFQHAHKTPLQQRSDSKFLRGVRSPNVEDFVNLTVNPSASLKYPEPTRIQPCLSWAGFQPFIEAISQDKVYLRKSNLNLQTEQTAHSVLIFTNKFRD